MYGLRMRLFFTLAKRICKRRFWQGVSVSIRGSVGEPGGCELLYRRLWETGNYLESSSTRDSKVYVQEGSRNGHLSP